MVNFHLFSSHFGRNQGCVAQLCVLGVLHVYTCNTKARVQNHTCRSEQGHLLIGHFAANFHRLIKVWEGHNHATITTSPWVKPKFHLYYILFLTLAINNTLKLMKKYIKSTDVNKFFHQNCPSSKRNGEISCARENMWLSGSTAKWKTDT